MSELFRGFNLREYNENVRRFFPFGIPLFAGMMIQSLLCNLYLTRLDFQEDFIGQMAGLAPLASGLFAVPTGIISDRIGRKPLQTIRRRDASARNANAVVLWCDTGRRRTSRNSPASIRLPSFQASVIQCPSDTRSSRADSHGRGPPGHHRLRRNQAYAFGTVT